MKGQPPQSYQALFREALGGSVQAEITPYPYQARLAEGEWPEALVVPTGLGKTAAVGLAWIHRRLHEDPDTPRRLVYCLPMRVLVEQTAEAFKTWLDRLDLLGDPGEGKISVNLLMGGEDPTSLSAWARHPEEEAILIGTQDMLLSRALMRGYGMSRYQWPMHFALLHSDCLWVFDEVQLMGPAASTSAQLEAFRRRWVLPAGTRTLWMSATLRTQWLDSVDFRPHLAGLRSATLGEADLELAQDRVHAMKRLQPSRVRLDRENSRRNASNYISDIAEEVLERRAEDGQTLVILNRVDRAQALFEVLRPSIDNLLLLHSRFRSKERRAIERALRDAAVPGRVVIATQAVEAGVDISSRVMFSELAPWDSLVQRFGRTNRYGEHAGGSDIYWIDIDDDADEAAPYDAEHLLAAREILRDLSSASPADLPPAQRELAPPQVLRRKDFLQLFDTDADITGFDIDVSPYIRDQGIPGVQAFWRDFDPAVGPPEDASGPAHEELCPASVGQFQAYMRRKVRRSSRRAWHRDPLLERWAPLQSTRPRPGMTLMLSARQGGYTADVGFRPDEVAKVTVLNAPESQPESHTDREVGDHGNPVLLSRHSLDVVRQGEALCARLGIPEKERPLLGTSMLWHDVGKIHAAGQTALRDHVDGDGPEGFLAKSGGSGRLRYRIRTEDGEQDRRYFRHELVSLLVWLERGPSRTEDAKEMDPDLVGYLIVAHHGRIRMNIAALPTEQRPPDDRLFARGIWEGDLLPAFSMDGVDIPETTVRLDLMRIGLGAQGPSWTERTRRLLQRHGPFQLAWWETLVRLADWRASAAEGAAP